ncbi:MAG: flagellar basal body P-ring formation chaperone FlgA [Xanthobacteraceae bacterium]
MIRLVALAALALLALPALAPSIASAESFVARFDSVSSLPKLVKAPAVPALKPMATVVGEIVRIGDLVENAGAASEIAIFRAPDLGQTGTVSAARIIDTLTQHEVAGVDTRGLTDVTVTRASRAIAPDEIEALILRAITARHRVADAGNVALAFDRELRTVHVEPNVNPDLRVARIWYEPRRGRFDIVFEIPETPRRLLRFGGTIAETFTAAVLARPVAAGSVIKETDIRFVRRPKSEFAANVVTEPNQAIGLAARRALLPGGILRQSDLAKPELIARNVGVTITYDVPGITLRLRGKALEPGAQGEVINVLNIVSKKTIQATVVGPGHVRVIAPARAIAIAPPPGRAMAASRSNIHPHAHARAE